MGALATATLFADTWTDGAAMATATTHIIYGYDRFGRLASVTSARLNGLDQPDPANVLRFDASGYAVAAEGPTTFYAYDNVGNLDTVTLPNGVVQDYDYDELNRLTDLRVFQGGRNLFEQAYTLANDGKRQSVLEKRWNADGTSFSSTLSTSAEN